jgi:hypothetical protein
MTDTKRCYTCASSGRQSCTICGGRGGRYKVTHDYDYDGHPITRERWKSCYSCGGQGTRLCWRCGATGTVFSDDNVDPSVVPIDETSTLLPGRETRRCYMCDGTGKGECRHCHGTGEYISNILGGVPCPYCSSCGTTDCTDCYGKGYRWRSQI